MHNEKMPYIDNIILEARVRCARSPKKAPKAAPLDLLSEDDYAWMDAFLDSNYGVLREFIDENYVALLLALKDYEPVDLRAKITAHLVHNIKNA